MKIRLHGKKRRFDGINDIGSGGKKKKNAKGTQAKKKNKTNRV